MGRIFNGIFLHMQLFVMFLFYFFMEYSRNILKVRPHPKQPFNCSNWHTFNRAGIPSESILWAMSKEMWCTIIKLKQFPLSFPFIQYFQNALTAIAYNLYSAHLQNGFFIFLLPLSPFIFRCHLLFVVGLPITTEFIFTYFYHIIVNNSSLSIDDKWSWLQIAVVTVFMVKRYVVVDKWDFFRKIW